MLLFEREGHFQTHQTLGREVHTSKIHLGLMDNT